LRQSHCIICTNSRLPPVEICDYNQTGWMA
jgi:hypothetical protein